jgi:hypothetical protein
MAETYLQFVPVDPAYQPSLAALEEARELLESILPQAREVNAGNYPGIQFFDSGQEWEYPTCPSCGAGSEDWFQHAMEHAWNESEGAYRDLSITTPCCSSNILLSQLHFPGGDRFASFLLEASSPWGDTTPAQDLQLEGILGSKLIKKLVAR